MLGLVSLRVRFLGGIMESRCFQRGLIRRWTTKYYRSFDTYLTLIYTLTLIDKTLEVTSTRLTETR